MSKLTDKEIAVIIDEMADLEKILKPNQKRYDELKKTLSKYANEQTNKGDVILTSDNNYIVYSKPSESLVCNYCPEKFVELTDCWDAIEISIKTAREQIDADLLKELFHTKLGSRRMLKIVPITSTDEIIDFDELMD